MKLRIGRREVNVSNPDKVFFPKRRLKKLDLVNYYLDVAPHVLNHVQRRPMQMLRYPDGAEEWFFYQKRVPANHPDWLETVHIKFPSGRTADFPVCNEAAALAWIVNLGCIDLHTWASRVDDVDRPDRLLIDLDPSEGNPWRHVRKIAMVVKEVMDELGLASFPKTSGATGLHILAPIKPELGFPEVRRFAKALAQEVERRIDDQEVATTTWKVADRRGVFVDFGQNSRDRTIASAYSIRPTPDARASAPLSWDEVPTVKPERFTLTTMRKRIDEVGDLTSGMWRQEEEPATALRQARPRAGGPEEARQRPPSRRRAALGERPERQLAPAPQRQVAVACPAGPCPVPGTGQVCGGHVFGVTSWELRGATRRLGRLGGGAGGLGATCTGPGPCPGGSG